MKRENRPSKLWPVGTPVIYLNAYGLDPVRGKVIAHYANEHNILVEDSRGVRHFGQTWRIDGEPLKLDMFDDLLGGDEPAPKPVTYDFEDLL